jgi:hypothetical protein
LRSRTGPTVGSILSAMQASVEFTTLTSGTLSSVSLGKPTTSPTVSVFFVGAA